MKPYYEHTHVPMEDHLQHLLTQIETWLASDNVDINAAKWLMMVVIKLLRGYKEQCETLSSLRNLNRFRLSRFEGSDDDIRFWTGFYSYKALTIFWEHYVEPNSKSMRYWGSMNANNEFDSSTKCGQKRRLCPLDELFMVLVKLKRGSANKDLAERFSIHETHVSRVFVSWIKLLHIVLESIDIWLPRSKVRKYMPACFKPLYRDVRVVIDCTEIRSERPSDFEVQCATYSSYKACNTHKALVGISPSGVPTFISELYEGSISDNNITNQSKLRDLMEPGDAIMADRGWTCASWLGRKGVRLVTPQFLHGKKQMDIPELVESVSIARVRIHVERCIGRIKQWHFLRQAVPLTYWNIVSDIFQVCGRLVIFWPPLIEDEWNVCQVRLTKCDILWYICIRRYIMCVYT